MFKEFPCTNHGPTGAMQKQHLRLNTQIPTTHSCEIILPV